jgi:hypothetical protein
MHKYLTAAIFLLFTVNICLAQTKTSTKSTVKQPVSELKTILAGTGLPYSIINDSLSYIPFEGENIAKYSVIVQKVGDLFIVYTSLTEILPGRIDETRYKYLLEQSNNYDIVKLCLDSEDKTVYARADMYKFGLKTEVLTRIIKQVANVTNILAGEMK